MIDLGGFQCGRALGAPPEHCPPPPFSHHLPQFPRPWALKPLLSRVRPLVEESHYDLGALEQERQDGVPWTGDPRTTQQDPRVPRALPLCQEARPGAQGHLLCESHNSTRH